MTVDDLIVNLQMLKVRNLISGDSEVHYASEKRIYPINGAMCFENTDKIYLTCRKGEEE